MTQTNQPFGSAELMTLLALQSQAGGAESIDDLDDDGYAAADGSEDYDDEEEPFDEDAGLEHPGDDERARRGMFRRIRTRKLAPVGGSRTTTLRSPNGQQMQVQLGSAFARAADVNKLIKDTEAKFAAAARERKANHEALRAQNAKLAARMKKMEASAQTSALMSLLTAPPKIERLTLRSTEDDRVVEGSFDVTGASYGKQDILLPLLMTGALGGGGSGGMDQTALLALALSR